MSAEYVRLPSETGVHLVCPFAVKAISPDGLDASLIGVLGAPHLMAVSLSAEAVEAVVVAARHAARPGTIPAPAGAPGGLGETALGWAGRQ